MANGAPLHNGTIQKTSVIVCGITDTALHTVYTAEVITHPHTHPIIQH